MKNTIKLLLLSITFIATTIMAQVPTPQSQAAKAAALKKEQTVCKDEYKAVKLCIKKHCTGTQCNEDSIADPQNNEDVPTLCQKKFIKNMICMLAPAKNNPHYQKCNQQAAILKQCVKDHCDKSGCDIGGDSMPQKCKQALFGLMMCNLISH